MGIEYTINISKDALNDITSIKRYILNTFKYREYAQNFSIKIKKSIQKLKLFPSANTKTEYSIEGLDIYYKPCNTYLIFYVVNDKVITVIRILKDRMYWQKVMQQTQNHLTDVR